MDFHFCKRPSPGRQRFLSGRKFPAEFAVAPVPARKFLVELDVEIAPAHLLFVELDVASVLVLYRSPHVGVDLALRFNVLHHRLNKFRLRFCQQ